MTHSAQEDLLPTDILKHLQFKNSYPVRLTNRDQNVQYLLVYLFKKRVINIVFQYFYNLVMILQKCLSKWKDEI